MSKPKCETCNNAPGIVDRGDGKPECRQCAAVTDVLLEPAKAVLDRQLAKSVEHWT